ncbi:CBO0543 family protein [Halalkalibacter okhensis]|uniref:CBO0543 family protein n=1 Tax=Halalkalibacter okhensis TaxID=333138 RepID=UPI00068F9A1E|nr:CBO0543 family protein [Halalkalibacter okhensis]
MTNREQVNKIMDENINQIQILLEQKSQIWLDHVLFTEYWWLGVALSIFPWIIWFIYRKKESSDRLLYAGFFVIAISLMLEVTGAQLGFWHYRYSVIPILPSFFPWDVALMPVTIMFFLQIKPKTSPTLKAILFALLTSYVAEPFFTWLGIYEPKSWRYSYSVPLQMFIYFTAHFLSKRSFFDPIHSIGRKNSAPIK